MDVEKSQRPPYYSFQHCEIGVFSMRLFSDFSSKPQFLLETFCEHKGLFGGGFLLFPVTILLNGLNMNGNLIQFLEEKLGFHILCGFYEIHFKTAHFQRKF